jgi:hypothetical protein
VPKVASEKIDAAVRQGVASGQLWLQTDRLSLCGEEVPEGELSPDARLLAAPSVSPRELLPDTLPHGWNDQATDGATLLDALSQKRGQRMPWGKVREALVAAYRVQYLEPVEDGVMLRQGAPGEVRLRLPGGAHATTSEGSVGGDGHVAVPSGQLWAETDLDLAGIQELADRIVDIQKEALQSGVGLRFFFRVEAEGAAPAAEKLAGINALLEVVSADLRLH